jgi:hypothetical protein
MIILPAGIRQEMDFTGEDPYHYTNATGKAFLNEIIKDFCSSWSLP